MKQIKPRVEFNSRGESGNIYRILGMVRTALQKLHRITDYNEIYFAVTSCGSYKEALDIIRQKIDLVDLDGLY